MRIERQWIYKSYCSRQSVSSILLRGIFGYLVPAIGMCCARAVGKDHPDCIRLCRVVRHSVVPRRLPDKGGDWESFKDRAVPEPLVHCGSEGRFVATVMGQIEKESRVKSASCC